MACALLKGSLGKGKESEGRESEKQRQKARDGWKEKKKKELNELGGREERAGVRALCVCVCARDGVCCVEP